MLSLILLNKSLQRLVIRSHYFQGELFNPLNHCYLLINEQWYHLINSNPLQIQPCSKPLLQNTHGEDENDWFVKDISKKIKLPQTIKYFRYINSTTPILHLVLENKLSIYLQNDLVVYRYRARKPLYCSFEYDDQYCDTNDL